MDASQQAIADLRAAVGLATIAGTAAAPVSQNQLLEMIVETAAHLIDAEAASLLLVDRATDELVFEVTLGQAASEVKKVRVPLGHGIAGLVAVSGQPMATSGGQHDPRQAADIAQRVGYTPQTILCMPLFLGDEVIGVLELLDKRNAASFTPADMEAIGLFANLAAIAIQQSRMQQDLSRLITDALLSLSDPIGTGSQQREAVQQRVRGFAADLESEAGYRWALEMASLVQQLAQQGDNERRMCESMLRTFLDYVQTQARQDDVQASL
ncbi:MAG: GAF domain-containing protein [Chloroflexi bacterium]|nr:GAF domain-containing protein [Chloroflexota bacterium]MBV9896953.1 GAF domain-containing protein [Chloroflexota bacterium]